MVAPIYPVKVDVRSSWYILLPALLFVSTQLRKAKLGLLVLYYMWFDTKPSLFEVTIVKSRFGFSSPLPPHNYPISPKWWYHEIWDSHFYFSVYLTPINGPKQFISFLWSIFISYMYDILGLNKGMIFLSYLIHNIPFIFMCFKSYPTRFWVKNTNILLVIRVIFTHTENVQGVYSENS